MATGVSPTLYPQQSSPSYELEPDNSYFLVKLRNAQAFFAANWLQQSSFLSFSSIVSSSFQANTPLQSLHTIQTLKKNHPCQLGIEKNLTTWLPARTQDSVNLTFEYTAVQGQPIHELLSLLKKLDLGAKVSMAKPELAIALKVSTMVGHLLSTLLGEGRQHEMFKLTIDLNVADLKAGYYIALGSYTQAAWPTALCITENGVLGDRTGLNSLAELSYVVIQVLGLNRIGEEDARDQSWWQLLQSAKERALLEEPDSDPQRRQLLQTWKIALSLVKQLAREQTGYLLRETQDILNQAHRDVTHHLLANIANESYGPDELPDEWQRLLGVATMQEFEESIRDYADAVKLSGELKKAYSEITNAS